MPKITSMGDRDAQIQIVKQRLIDQGYPPHVAEEMAVHRVGTMSGYYGVKARPNKELNSSIEVDAENYINEIFGVTAILGGPPSPVESPASGQPSGTASVASPPKTSKDGQKQGSQSGTKAHGAAFGKVGRRKIEVDGGLLPSKNPHLNEMIKMKAIEDEFGIK